MRLALLVLGAAAACGGAHAAFCHGAPKPGPQPNLYPINEAEPTFVTSVANGKHYMAGQPGFEFHVVHVWGTPYEMGFAQGELMKDLAQNMLNETWTYMQGQVTSSLPQTFPQWLQLLIADVGLDAALDLTYAATRNFTGEYIWEEMQGLADGAGVSFDLLVKVHMLAGVTQGDCSLFGANGTATADGTLVQLRALDWDTTGPFKDYSSVTVYHPSGDGDGQPFVNMGFVGFIGTVTGQSAAHQAISEIGVSYPDSTFGSESRVGVPFVFLLREILQFDTELAQSVQRIQTANRTCDLILAVGNGKTNTFAGFEYSYSVADVFEDWNATRPANATWHPAIQDVIYWGMDWDCPTYNLALSQQLAALHGNITAPNAIREVTSIVQTGDLHVHYAELATNTMYVSFMQPTNGTTGLPEYAYDRQFTALNLEALFAEEAP